MRTGMIWGTAVLMTVWTASALAQVPQGSGGSSAHGGTAAPSAAPPPAATAPAATAATPEQAAPAEVAPVPVAPAAPEVAPASPKAEEDEQEEEAPRRKKKKRRYYVEDEREEEEEGEERDREDEVRSTRRGSDWKLRGSHFILSAERLTSILSWSQTSKSTATVTDPNTGGSLSRTVESEESGTDVSLLGAGGFVQNPFSIPRVGFDYMFANGFTLGGSLGYMVTSGKSEDKNPDGTSRTEDRPTVDILLFAPRLGMFIAAAPTLGVWLRGGITRLAMSAERQGTNEIPSSTQTVTFVDATLDPQLVFSPAPRVGITVGPTLDIGLSGSVELTGSSNFTSADTEISASSYGVTAGLVALF